ncbi:MAG: Cu(I)-responsive transcriptional regulator [Betaproteobacteria bacterium]|nr:Cu(I)-responsive transcriptional regulator [Betaproteobacteria bacterium]
MKIGEVSNATGVSQRMIRHYEKIGLIPPAPRRESGYRDYDRRDLHALRFIGRARDLGFPIEDIRALLALWNDRSRSSAEVKLLALARASELRDRIAVLDGMRRTLEYLADSCHGDDRPECPILDDLEEGDHERPH